MSTVMTSYLYIYLETLLGDVCVNGAAERELTAAESVTGATAA